MDEAAKVKSRSLRSFAVSSKFNTLIIVVVLAVLLGSASGYFLSSKQTSKVTVPGLTNGTPQTPQQDSTLCRDFAEGTIKAKPTGGNTDDYSEGTHLLQRDSGQPVALTSSVVDLSQYENKKVKVFGETQKALKEGWLMDVCRVETE